MFEWSSALKPFRRFEMLTFLSHSSIALGSGRLTDLLQVLAQHQDLPLGI
jgi:hypothetical protein